jgi:ketosteroid isomerase-like protein
MERVRCVLKTMAKEMRMSSLFRVGMVIGAIALAGIASGCGSGAATPRLTAADQVILSKYAIDQIERKWHQAEMTQNTSEMMSLWAPHAIFQLDPTHTLVGKKQIQRFWTTQIWPVARKQHWLSDTSTPRIRVTVEGDKGTLYFECHEIDAKTHKILLVVGQTAQVAKIGGRWLITKTSGSSPML